MLDRIKQFLAPLALATIVAICTASGAAAADAWRVSKSSGDVSVTTAAGAQAALAAGATVNPGDNIRTGQNGRALLTRGEESILISPNSVIGLPAQQKSELSTTIIQQAGSILLEVEKRNVKHFQVETPYLAAVVKGTQFRVTVGEKDSRVDVLRGQVEVADFKSGQYALVVPGQAAQVAAQGSGGLSLSGSGTLSPIQYGAPRVASVSPLAIAKESIPTQAPANPVIAPSAPPSRVAQISQPQPASRSWSSASSSGDNGRSGWWDGGFFSSSGKGSRQENIAVAAVVSCAIGFFVTAMVGTLRRRKSKKISQGLT